MASAQLCYLAEKPHLENCVIAWSASFVFPLALLPFILKTLPNTNLLPISVCSDRKNMAEIGKCQAQPDNSSVNTKTTTGNALNPEQINQVYPFF